MSRLFGTDGVRGIVNDNLTSELALKIGIATSCVLGNNKKIKVIVGRDTRYSGEMLNFSIVSGLMSGGAEVIDVGIVPTPCVSYLIGLTGADAGIMISASHNPSEYNGIKIFNEKGYKLDDTLEDKIEGFILSGKSIDSTSLGSYRLDSGLKSKYINHLLSVAKVSKSLKVVVDCANGSASVTAPDLFKKLGIDATIINSDFDGYNINKNCGSTHLDILKEKVLEMRADLGIAYDGDADRCLFIDNTGEEIDGDYVLSICGKYYKDKNILKNNAIVGTVMSNLGLRKFCESESINFEATKVGDRYVLENMLLNDYIIGGEQSGHIIFKEYANTGDGELTSIMVLNVLSDLNKSLSELKNVMRKYPQVLINVEVRSGGKEDYKKDNEIVSLIKSTEESLGDDGRVLIRPSGTENLIRVMLEGSDLDDIEEKANKLADLIKEKVGK